MPKQKKTAKQKADAEFKRVKLLVEEGMDIYEDLPDGAYWACVAEYAGFEGGGLSDLIEYLEEDAA